MAHTGTSNNIVLVVAASAATVDSPSVIFSRIAAVGHPRLDPSVIARRKKIAQTDSAQELGADSIGNHVHHLAAVLRRIHVHAERPAPEGTADDVHHGSGDGGDIGIGRFAGGEAGKDFVGETCGGPSVVLGHARVIGRRAGMREVMGAFGEGARHHDRGFDAPACQLGGIADGDCIHGGLRREVGREVRRRTAAVAAAADP
jgi:hypothetical protein